ncbi:IS66 family transposase, partial [Limosilactobacillus reuteri]
GRIIGQIVGNNYPGIIMCDGYKGYSNQLYPQAKFGSCLVHIRREFVKLVKALPKTMKASKAQQAITLLSQVFHSENQLSYQTANEK